MLKETDGHSQFDLEDHLRKVSLLRRRLFELDQQIKSGAYTVETLQAFQDTYLSYVTIRADHSS